MNFKVLPPKYYLTHFLEVLDTLDCFYQPVFEPEHLAFIDDFRMLSEDAQCLYVRMVNRKGNIFLAIPFRSIKRSSFSTKVCVSLNNRNLFRI
jgi:DNA polymerase-3 subunit epsilon